MWEDLEAKVVTVTLIILFGIPLLLALGWLVYMFLWMFGLQIGVDL